MARNIKRIIITSFVASTIVMGGCDDKKKKQSLPPAQWDGTLPAPAPVTAPAGGTTAGAGIAAPTPAPAPGGKTYLDAVGKKEIVGVWQSVKGDPKQPGAFYSVMTMEVRPDQTLTYSIEMPDLQNPGAKIVKRAEGRITHETVDDWYINLEQSTAGGELPPDQRRIRFWMPTERGGTYLLVQPDGPRFDRKKP